MQITSEAATAILQTMRKKGLDPSKTFFYVEKMQSGAVGIGFDRTPGPYLKVNDLMVKIDPAVTEKLRVDYGLVAGRKGIILVPQEQ